jgi:hypothetical protein
MRRATPTAQADKRVIPSGEKRPEPVNCRGAGAPAVPADRRTQPDVRSRRPLTRQPVGACNSFVHRSVRLPATQPTAPRPHGPTAPRPHGPTAPRPHG